MMESILYVDIYARVCVAILRRGHAIVPADAQMILIAMDARVAIREMRYKMNASKSAEKSPSGQH